MKILATFDGSRFSEAVLPHLQMLAALPGSEFVLLSVGHMPGGKREGGVELPAVGMTTFAGATATVLAATPARYAETKDQAVERRSSELHDYLEGIARRLPEGTACRLTTLLDGDPAAEIIKFALTERPDIIVMATHGHTGLAHILFGDVAESVVRSGVAPVLLVHPDAIRISRRAPITT